MNHSLEDLNDSQFETLKQLKMKISDVLPSDYPDIFLIRFLRANNYNLKKTETTFRGTMRARKVYDIDTTVECYEKPEVVKNYEFTSFLGLARDGSPIRYTRFGRGDYLGFLMSLDAYEIVKYAVYVIECDIAAMRKHNEKAGKPVTQVTYIIDCSGFTLRDLLHQNAMETAVDLILMMQEHYPEIWGNILCINAPRFFDKAFNIFKPILRLNMLEKIRVASRESTADLLIKYIDENVLPAFLGGKRTDSTGNPRCPEFVKFGGTVPVECYRRNRAPLMPSDPGVTCQWVPARSVFNHFVVVREGGSKIRIEIRSENGSIGLKMLYREFGDDPENLDLPSCNEYLDDSNPACNVKFCSPGIRVQTHTTPVDTACNAPWPGIYIFRFDNTYGWFSARKIIFRIREVKEPGQT